MADRDDIDFDKDGKPSKFVRPPTEQEEREAEAYKAKREADIKKSAAEFEANPRRAFDAERKLKDYIMRRRMGIGSGGGSGGRASDAREMQLGAELDPKALMKRSGYKKGGAVKSASARADGIAQRGKTRGRMV